MVRSDRDHALQLLEMATRDHTALSHMLNAIDFPEEVFGFHAQQSIEKALKAWIAVRHLAYPKTHDLGVLVRILAEAGTEVGSFEGLEEYTIYAVQYRYESYDEAEEKLNRKAVIAETEALLQHVRQVIEAL